MTNARAQLDALIAGVNDGRSLQELIDASTLAILVANDTGSFVMTNDAASGLTGYSTSELLKLSVWQLTPDVHEREAETLCRAFRQQAEQSGTYKLVRKDGRTIVALYAAKTNVVRGLHVSVLSEPVEP